MLAKCPDLGHVQLVLDVQWLLLELQSVLALGSNVLVVHSQPPSTTRKTDVASVELDIPLNTMDIEKEIVIADMTLPASLEPIDFLEKICIKLGIPREHAQLGYKWPSDAAGMAWRALSTPDDVRKLVEENTQRKQAWRANMRVVRVRIDVLVSNKFIYSSTG